jgi:N-dimethylarginine dimethylaminohydrolase
MVTLSGVITRVEEIPAGFSATSLRELPLPRSVLMCPPTYFDVIDVKNVFMGGQLGKVNHEEAVDEWSELKSSYERKGITVEEIDPLEGCEDMVFCANPVFPGISSDGQRKCVLSKMNHPSRQREVAAVAMWFKRKGYEIVDLGQNGYAFEGGGDAIWHPGLGLIWGGYGQRTERGVYYLLTGVFDFPVVTLKLCDARFYHLDTCFCPIDQKTVMFYPPAFTEEGVSLIRRFFPRVVIVDEDEAVNKLACNAVALRGKYIFIQRGAVGVSERLRGLGYEVIEVETEEFMKSGGSVFCMKSAVF